MNLTPKQKAHRRADEVFRSILPQQGLAVRENQILLCHQMLDTLFGGEIALCDAGVGIGKTHAYLLACVLWQKYAPDAQGRSVTISTSSHRLAGGHSAGVSAAAFRYSFAVWHRQPPTYGDSAQGQATFCL